MTQTMRARLIEIAARKLLAYDRVYDEEREGTGAEIVDAILAELREPDEAMCKVVFDTFGECEAEFTAMIDAVRGQR